MTEAMQAAAKSIGEEDLDRQRETYRANLRGAIDYADANESSHFTKLADKPTFDPRMEAMKRINREDMQRQVNEQYKALGGPDEGKPELGMLGKLAPVVAAATVALGYFKTAVEVTTIVARADSAARQKLLAGNDVIGAEIDRERGKAAVLRQIPLVGGILGAIKEYGIAKRESYLGEYNAVRSRAEMLGQYNPMIGREVARGQFAQRARDVNEAGLFGSQFAEVLRATNEQEELKQKLGEVIRAKELPNQLRAIKDENEKMRKQLSGLLEKLPTAMANAMQKQRSGDPFDELRDLKIPEDHRPGLADAERRGRDARLNGPVFGG